MSNAVLENTLNTDVVLNNKAKTPTTVADQVSVVLDTLIAQREDWENNAYRVSNQQLYGILAKCYALDWEIANTSEGVKKMRDAVNSYASRLGFSFKDGTPMINRIVRCVFGNVHRTRISTYSLVLREAKKQEVAIADIPAFIEQAGGLQEIRMSKSETYKSPKAKAEIAETSAYADTLAVAKSAALSQKADPQFEGTRCVLLSTQQANGGFAVHAVIRSKQAVQAALLTHYGAINADANKRGKTSAANDEQFRVDLVGKILARQ
jgi:hypothetical protein